jgi:hypothetical protein
MIIRSNFAERRKHHRFKVNEGALAEFHKPRLFKLGKSRVAKSAQIVDISLEGLSYQYADRNMWTTDFKELTISMDTAEIKIDKVLFKTISDFSTSRLPNSKFIRRCGIKFGELRPSQKNQLHYFIQNLIHPTDRRTGKERRALDTSKNGGLEKRNIIERRKRLL